MLRKTGEGMQCKEVWVSVILGALCLLITVPTDAKTGGAVAVLDLQPRGVDRSVAESLTDIVVKEIDRFQAFSTITKDEIQKLLEHAEQKQAMGCDDTSCLAEIGGALGVDFLVSGGVGRLGGVYMVSLKLIDVRNAKVVSRQEREVRGSEEELIAASRAAAQALMRPLAKEASGKLSVTCSEEGAEVYIDDELVGMTPLGAKDVAAGLHTVRLRKKGFIVFARNVTVKTGEVTRLDARLVPSREFREEYEARATTFRTLAWVFTGVAVAATGTAAGLFGWNSSRLDKYEEDRSEWESDPSSHDPRDLNERADSINMVDSAALGLAVGGAAALGAALYFWLAGDPPDKYKGVDKVSGLAPQRAFLVLGPGTHGGAWLAISCTW